MAERATGFHLKAVGRAMIPTKRFKREKTSVHGNSEPISTCPCIRVLCRGLRIPGGARRARRDYSETAKSEYIISFSRLSQSSIAIIISLSLLLSIIINIIIIIIIIQLFRG